MGSILKFRGHYFIIALVIFFVEILIALYVHDRIVRPYVGDFLVVILVYCFLRAFINSSVIKLALAALLISYAVEILQYADMLGRLGLQDSALARVVMGTSFEWIDMVAYTLGIALVLYVEKMISRQRP